MPIHTAIPSWNAEGLLPPIDVVNPTSANRAPYAVTLTDCILHFATSPERVAILAGFLDYRDALHNAGLSAGFQWLNGSFLEHIEVSPRRRPPNDVDLVTFFRLPPGRSQADLASQFPELFAASASDHDALKRKYRVDAYIVSLEQAGERLVSRSVYWYSVWAHQRDTLKWKGFLQLDLAPADDATARQFLTIPQQGSTP